MIWIVSQFWCYMLNGETARNIFVWICTFWAFPFGTHIVHRQRFGADCRITYKHTFSSACTHTLGCITYWSVNIWQKTRANAVTSHGTHMHSIHSNTLRYTQTHTRMHTSIRSFAHIFPMFPAKWETTSFRVQRKTNESEKSSKKFGELFFAHHFWRTHPQYFGCRVQFV